LNHLNDFVILLAHFRLQTGYSNLEQLVLTLALVHLTLQKLLILFKSLRPGLPVLNFTLKLVFVLLSLNLVFIKFLNALL
jgi:hypothetical protein